MGRLAEDDATFLLTPNDYVQDPDGMSGRTPYGTPIRTKFGFQGFLTDLKTPSFPIEATKHVKNLIRT